jgi:hypothetical protein
VGRRNQLRQAIEDAQTQLVAARQSTLDFAAAMRALVGQQQEHLDNQLSFLDRLDEIKAEEVPAAPVEETPQTAPETQEDKGLDEELEAKMAAAAAAAEASPESAYQSFDENALNAALSGQEQEADEPTRVVDLSQADQSQEYKV